MSDEAPDQGSTPYHDHEIDEAVAQEQTVPGAEINELFNVTKLQELTAKAKFLRERKMTLHAFPIETEIAELKSQMHPVTGLPNKNVLMEQWERIQHYDGAVGLIAVDLNKFKEVNDAYGHAAGDEVLKAAGIRLLATTRAVQADARETSSVLPQSLAENYVTPLEQDSEAAKLDKSIDERRKNPADDVDIVFERERLPGDNDVMHTGGDEFMILVLGKGLTEQVMERIRNKLEEDLYITGADIADPASQADPPEFTVTGSVGYSLSLKGERRDLKKMMTEADTMVQISKLKNIPPENLEEIERHKQAIRDLGGSIR